MLSASGPIRKVGLVLNWINGMPIPAILDEVPAHRENKAYTLETIRLMFIH